jgi:hypothetical protein
MNAGRGPSLRDIVAETFRFVETKCVTATEAGVKRDVSRGPPPHVCWIHAIPLG